MDMYYRHIQRVRYHRYRYRAIVDSYPPINPSLALWKFATAAILDQVRDRQRRWTWIWLSERRKERKRYVYLFRRKQEGRLGPAVRRSLCLGRNANTDDMFTNAILGVRGL
jgi:vacuolar protein sorting-associated protein 13A/C